MKMTKNNNINISESHSHISERSHISSENSHNIKHHEKKIRRKSASSSTSEVSNPAPLPTSENNNTAFGQQLLLALSKARAVAAFDSA